MNTTFIRRMLACGAALALSFGAPAAEPDPDHGATLQLNQGKKWSADAPLRAENLHVVLAEVLNAYGRYFEHPGWGAF